MSKHINFQTITKDGQPVFAVVPYDDFIQLIKDEDDEPTIPHAVILLVAENDYSLARAWRKYLGLTQAEVARRIGISAAALSQIERSGKTIRENTLIKLAKAMDLHPEQLRE